MCIRDRCTIGLLVSVILAERIGGRQQKRCGGGLDALHCVTSIDGGGVLKIFTLPPLWAGRVGHLGMLAAAWTAGAC
eukprot:1194265-Prorocentrum_minimum.AAC.1